MIEKLLENWLDRASERSYQAVFVQMLAAEGYAVLHSTRHCLLEYGKDILAIAPDGVGCAFQLKGDPGGRMKISEFRKDIQPQLTQLMAQSPSYPGFPKGTHRAYLVSNGQFEEEVQIAVREMNDGPYLSKVCLWSRGHLFDMCKRHGAVLWPSELKDNRALLELYMANSGEPIEVDVLAGMMESVLGLSEGIEIMKQTELARAATSAAWLTGIAVAAHAEKENHHAVISAWTLCCVSLIAAAEKHNGKIASVEASLLLAQNALFDALAALWEEVKSDNHLVEGDPFTDPEVFAWRVGILFGLLSCLAIADAEISILDESSRTALRSWLMRPPHKPELWGEAAVASLVPWLVWLRKHDPTSRPDAEISQVAAAVVILNQPKSQFAMPNPYYDFETVIRHRLGLKPSPKKRSLAREAVAGNAFTAEALLHLLVRTNLKSKCKLLWSRFTKLSHHRLALDISWHYCLIQAPSGVNETKVYPSTYSWGQLKSNALGGMTEVEIPTSLQRSPWMLALWWQIAPHRMSSDSVRVFAEGMLPGWGA